MYYKLSKKDLTNLLKNNTLVGNTLDINSQEDLLANLDEDSFIYDKDRIYFLKNGELSNTNKVMEKGEVITLINFIGRTVAPSKESAVKAIEKALEVSDLGLYGERFVQCLNVEEFVYFSDKGGYRIDTSNHKLNFIARVASTHELFE